MQEQEIYPYTLLVRKTVQNIKNATFKSSDWKAH